MWRLAEKVNTETKINNKTIKQIESTLSVLNSKTIMPIYKKMGHLFKNYLFLRMSN